MRFFVELHRSVMEPLFYNEVVLFRRLHVFGYLWKLLALTALCTGLAHTYYFTTSQKSVAAPVVALMSGMEIRDGVLDPKVETPYVPPSYIVKPVLDQLFGDPNLFSARVDSALVIDTGLASDLLVSAPVIVLSAKEIVVTMSSGLTLQIPYNRLLFGLNDLQFTTESVSTFLKKNFFNIYLLSIFWFGVQNLVSILFSIFFLSTAAFLFRIERTRKIRDYFRVACFAVTPVAIGNILVAVSGVTLSWTWHIFIFFATLVMFRAMVVITRPDSTDKELL